MEKTRSVPTAIISQTISDYENDGTPLGSFSGTPFVERYGEASIRYTNGFGKTNYCLHQTVNYTKMRPDPFQITYPSGSRRVFSHVSFDFDTVWIDKIPSAPLPANGQAQFILRAIQNTRPKFKAPVSMPNFLYELKDLKRLVPSYRTIRSYSEFLAGVSNRFFSNLKKRADVVSDATASQYLNAKFGYLPLIDDLVKLDSAIKSYNSTLRKFIRDGTRTQRSLYREEVEAFTGSNISLGTNAYANYYSRTRYSKTYYTLTIRYGYNVRLPMLRVPNTFLKYLGFRNNPRILWDAIPFSFVLDWFFRFGKALESFDSGAIPIELSILDCTLTVKYSGITGFYGQDRFSNWGAGFGTESLLSNVGFTYFERQRIDPGSILLSGLPPLPTFDKVSIQEILLGAALGKTLTSRHK
jgi:hypothetical protein